MEGLGINLPTLLAQIVNFLILLGLLYLVDYKPILRMFDERSKRIKESMDQTEAIKEQAEHTEEEIKKRLDVASKEGQELVARAVRTGDEARQKIQQEARHEAEGIIEKARLEIERERDEAIADLRKEFADMTVMAAGKVIGKSLSKEEHRDLIDKVLDESAALKKK